MFPDLLDRIGGLELAVVGVAGLLVFGRRWKEEALGLLDRWLGH
jgi:hypothetical protein